MDLSRKLMIYQGEHIGPIRPPALANALGSLVRIWPQAAAVAAATLVLIVYLSSLAATVFGLDSAELAAAAYTLGLAHGPGYPVYLLLANLFTHLPLGDVGYRVNLLSAVAGAGMVGMLVLLILHITKRPMAAMLAGLSFGLSYYVWAVSVVAEVYTLQGLMLAAILWALFVWRKNGEFRYLLLATFLAALALANTPASLLWWPGLLYFIWFSPHRPRLALRDRLLLIVVGFLGLIPLLYIPVRSALQPAFAYVGEYNASGAFQVMDLTKLDNLLWYLSAQQFSHMFPGYSPASLPTNLAHFLHQLWAAFLGVGLPLGLWGLRYLWTRSRTVAISLALTALPHAVFFIGYGARDKDMMFLPVFLVWAVFLGAGFVAAERTFSRRWLVAGLMLPTALFLINWPFIDVSDSWKLSEQASVRLEQSAANAVYIAHWGDASMMHYLQTVDGLRTDVKVVNTFFVTEDTLQPLIERALAAGREVYVSKPSIVAVDEFRFVPVRYGFEVIPK